MRRQALTGGGITCLHHQAFWEAAQSPLSRERTPCTRGVGAAERTRALQHLGAVAAERHCLHSALVPSKEEFSAARVPGQPVCVGVCMCVMTCRVDDSV